MLCGGSHRSDPTESDEVHGVHANRMRGGAALTYGPDRVQRFCADNGLDMVIRAHGGLPCPCCHVLAHCLQEGGCVDSALNRHYTQRSTHRGSWRNLGRK